MEKPNTEALEGYNANRGGPGAAQQSVDEAHQAYANKLSAISNALGGEKFDPAKGMQDYVHGLRLSSIDTPADRVTYLQKNGYDAKNVQGPDGGAMTVFRNKGEDTWHPINGQEWSMSDAGRATAQAPMLAAQVGTTVATDGLGLPLRMAIQALVGGGEKRLEQLGNEAAGTNTQTMAQNAKGAAGAGATSALGELLGSILAYGSNTVKGVQKGVFKPTNEGESVMASQNRLNAASPPGGDISVTPGAVGAPGVALREKQISPLSVTMQNAYDAIRDKLGGLLEGRASGLTGGAAPAVGDSASTVGGTTYPGIGDIMSGLKQEASKPVADAVPTVELSQGGNALRQGAQAVKEGLTARTSAKYGDIPDQGVGFDVSPMKQTAEELSKGIKAKGYPKVEETTTPGDQFGDTRPVTTTTETPTTVTLGEMPAGYMSTIVGQVKKMFPKMETVEGRTPYEQLQNLRTKIGYAASEYPVGGNPAQVAEFHQARAMLGSLDNVLANPEGANAANFGEKLLAAQRAARQQNQVLDNPMIQKIRDKQVPPEDLMQYAEPGNYTNLALLKRSMPKEDFARFQDAWASSLARNPDRIPALLKGFNSDPRSLALLADPARRQLLTDYASAMEKLSSSPVAGMMAEKNFANRPGIALSAADADQVGDLITRAGGADSPIGQNIRAAVFKNIIQGGQKMGRADFTAIANASDKALSSPNVGKVLTAEDTQFLQDIRTVAKAQGKVASGDMQGGMAAGADVKKAFKNPLMALLTPKSTAEGLGSVFEAYLQSRMWASPYGRRFMVGSGNGISPDATISQRISGAVGADYEANNPNSAVNKVKGRGNMEPTLSAP